MTHRVIYPGSFDPVTNGHLDVIERAQRLFGGLTVVVARSSEKDELFSVEERVDLLRQVTKHLKGVDIDSASGLIVHYAQKRGSQVLIRGLRAVSDFDFEFSITAMNRSLNPNLETVFLMTNERMLYVSSRLVKEVACYGGDIRPHVPPAVHAALMKKFPDAETKS